MEEIFKEVYAKFKLNFYRGIFEHVKEHVGSLSAVEAFAAEVIYALREPTISEFAESIGISQPNATYKVNALIKKGYITKTVSPTDKREYHLKVTDRFLDYYNINNEYIDIVMARIRQRFSDEQANQFQQMLWVISRELMPENSQIQDRQVLKKEYP